MRETGTTTNVESTIITIVPLLDSEGMVHPEEQGQAVGITIPNPQAEIDLPNEINIESHNPKIERLLEELHSGGWEVRMHAADVLGEIKSSSPEVISGLVAALEDKYDYVRVRAADALGEIKSSSPEVIRGLLAALKDRNLDVRRRVAVALVKIGTPEVISGLLVALKGGKDKDVRSSAASALGGIEPSSPEVISGLLSALKDDKDKDVRSSAASALGKINSSSPEVVSGLLAALKDDKDGYVKSSAADALGEIKSSSSEVIGGLLATLKDDDKDVRMSAADALGEIKSSSPKVIVGWLAALKDNDKDVRVRTAGTLGEIKSSATAEVISGWLTALKDEDKGVRMRAADALGAIKSSAPEVIRGLLTALKDDKDEYVRWSAADALGAIKSSSPEVISGWLAALKDGKDEYVRVRAADALGAIKSSSAEVISGWLTALNDDDKDVRMRAAGALRAIKSSAPEVIRGLLAALKDKNQYEYVRSSATDALGEIKSSSPEIISGLLAVLRDEEYEVRRRAASALGKINSSSPEVISGLLAALKDDKDKDVRRSTVEVLGKINSSSPEVISGLLAALKDDKDKDVRMRAADALGAIKSSSPEVISGLVAALKHDNSDISSSAASALGEIKSSAPRVIDSLLGVLQNKESTVRINAITSLKKIESSLPNEVIKGLIGVIRDLGAIKDEEIKEEDKEVKEATAKLWKLISNNWDVLIASKFGSLDNLFQQNQVYVDILKQLGAYYYKRLDYEKAATQYVAFLEWSHKLNLALPGELEDQATLLGRTIKACIKANRPELLDKAEDYFVSSRLKFNELEKKGLLTQDLSKEYVELLINIGSFYLKTSNYHKTAEKYFKLASEKVGVDRTALEAQYLNILNQQALLFLKQEKNDEAIGKFKEAREYYNGLKEKSTDVADTYVSICKGTAGTYIELNRMEEAWVICEEAFALLTLMDKETFASFDRIIGSAIDIMRLQVSCTKDIEKRERIGAQLKNLERMPEDLKDVKNEKWQESRYRATQLRPKLLEALVDCYSEIDVKEAEYWIKKEKDSKQQEVENKLEGEEKYYVEAALLNSIATSRTVKNGSIDISVTGKGKKALCRETWISLNEAEREEVRRDTKVESLDLDSLTTKDQDAIKDLVQSNIEEAVRYVYGLTKGEEAKELSGITYERTRETVEAVAYTLSKGIIKTKSNEVKEQHKYLIRKHDAAEFPYTQAANLDSAFKGFCEEFGNRIRIFFDFENEQEKVEWAKGTAAWIEYRVNLTDHFYADGCGKVATVLASFVCALADFKMPVLLGREDYFLKDTLGAGRTVRKDAIKEDEDNLQFSEWKHHYDSKFPPEQNFSIWTAKLEQLGKDIEKSLKSISERPLAILPDKDKELLLGLPKLLSQQIEELRKKEDSMKLDALQFKELESYKRARSELPKEIEELSQELEEILEGIAKQSLKVVGDKKSQEQVRGRLLKKIERLPERINNLSESEAVKPMSYYIAEANQNLERISKLVGSATLSTTSYGSKKAAIREYDPSLLSSKVEADFTETIERLYYIYNPKDSNPNEIALEITSSSSDKEENIWHKPNTEAELSRFVQEVAYNLLKSNLNLNSKDDIFREADEEENKQVVKNNFYYFIREFKELLEKLEKGETDAKYVCAVIHYRLGMTGKFFKDGNKRIALALETFVMIGQNYELPNFFNEVDWKVAAPQLFRKEESMEYGSDLSKDARFFRWYYKYNQLFGESRELQVPLDKIKNHKPANEWEVMAEAAFARALERQHTIYDENFLFQEAHIIRSYIRKTGIEIKKLAVFYPERMLQHEVIASVVTSVALPVKGEKEELKKIVEQVRQEVESSEVFKKLAGGMTTRFNSFREIVRSKVEGNVGLLGDKSDQYSSLIEQYTAILSKHYKSTKKRMKVEDEKETLCNLVSWDLLRREYQVDIEMLVADAMLNLKNNQGKEGIQKVEFLSQKAGHERAVWVLAGGAASGKTTIFDSKVKEQVTRKLAMTREESNLPENTSDKEMIKVLIKLAGNDNEATKFRARSMLEIMGISEDLINLSENKEDNIEVIDACNINPDIFKPLLLDIKASNHAERTHEESSYIKDLVLKKLEVILTKTEKAPSMVLDVVNPDLKKFEAILKDNPKINLYATTCPVLDSMKATEVANISEITTRGAIGRAFDRASSEFSVKMQSKKMFLDKKTNKLLVHESLDDKDKKTKNADYERYVPTYVILDGHKKVSESFPGFINSGKYSVIELYDNSAKPVRVCHMEGRDLRIDNFNKFIDFIQKRYINVKAYSADKVYQEDLMQSSSLKSEYVATALAEYLKLGIRIHYGNHTSWDKGLVSRNLVGTLKEFTIDISERAKDIFEALIIDVLGRYSFKQGLPVQLLDNSNRKISVFSNEIEDHLNKGAMFRFLNCVSNVILKEQGIVLGESTLGQVSKDVLKVIVDKGMSREEDGLIRNLPSMIDRVRYTASIKQAQNALY